MVHYTNVKPLIGITCGEVRNSKYPWMSVTYAQGHAYCDAVLRAGGIPVIMPFIADEKTLHELYSRCDGILIAGGNDIDPTLYGQKQHAATGDISQQRDKQELKLAEWTLADDKPLLGICRGIQLLNIYLGGSLHQHIPDDIPEAQNHEVSAEHENTAQLAHDLELEPTSLLGKIVGTQPLPANSQHHQALSELGKGLMVNARAEDGIIEGVEVPSKVFCIAVQPHPEGIEADVEPRWQKLFTAFVDASSQARRN